MSGPRYALPILLTLAAASGAALTLVVRAVATEGDDKASPVTCKETGVIGVAGASRREEELASQNGELRRALLAALAGGSECNAAPALPSETPPPPAASIEQYRFDPPSPEEIAEQETKEMASLQGELNAEPVDPVWAPRMEQAAARAVAAVESLRVEGVECRESLCQVRVTHRDPAHRDDDVEKLLSTMPDGGQARVYAPADAPTTVMYFSRKGMLLSVLSPPTPSLPPANAVESGDAP